MSHVGCRTLDVMDPVQGAQVPARVLYPTATAGALERFGPYALELAIDAAVEGERLPVVLISHGNGGSPWTYRELAASVARAGFVVLMVEHVGNSRSDNSLAETAANLANRPRHVRLALDAVFADPALAAHLIPDRAVVIGHSIGGYTALAVAGGHPLALPHQTADGVAKPVAVEPDPRVIAAVLLAPALPWLMGPGALADVHVPLLVRVGERDELLPPEVVARILGGLPPTTRIDYQVVPGAGHFSFQTPFPPAMVSPAFPPSQDPPGFDRAAYQPRLIDEVIGFLRGVICP